MLDSYGFVAIGEGRWLDEEYGFTFEKDMSGMWWAELDGLEVGPFNTLEHAEDCLPERYLAERFGEYRENNGHYEWYDAREQTWNEW